MTELRIGSLFSGYGGLDLGVMLALGGRVVWHAEIDPAPARILAARFPGVPNLGDVTAVDWDAVEPVDVLTGGFPCQDVSHAGKRAGLRPDTRSGLWSVMAYVIDQLRPQLVVIENVRGLLSAAAHSDVESCPGCLGDGNGEPALRALGAVLGDLAGLGFDAEWRGIRAADVGAPHGRWREFIVAADTSSDPRWVLDGNGRAAGHPDHEPETAVRGLRDGAGTEPGRAGRAAGDPEDVGHERGGPARDGRPGPADAGRRPTADADAPGLPDGLPARGELAESARGASVDRRRAAAADAGGQRHGGREDARGLGRVDGEDASPARERERARREPGDRGATAHADPEGDRRDERRPESARVERRPDAAECGIAAAAYARSNRRGRGTERHQRPIEPGQPASLRNDPDRLAVAVDWGAYGPAIARWTSVLGRPAPLPWELGRTGGKRLAPPFVEWMLGLPAGWVTDVEGITRNEQLKALGNGVVPQQAAAAVTECVRALAVPDAA